MGYVIYARAVDKKTGEKERYGPWEFKVYKTRDGAKRAMARLIKKHGKKGKRPWYYEFTIRKKKTVPSYYKLASRKTKSIWEMWQNVGTVRLLI